MPENKVPNTLQDNIADTLFITLFLKSKETNRENPFFADPIACELVKKIDYDFEKYDKAVRSSVGVALRSRYFDEVAAEFIHNHPAPIIVNVGCGLDTRFQRLGEETTRKAIFYELDIPEVVEFRQTLLPESENDLYLPNSVFDTDWMDSLKEKHPRADFLFLVEGVFMFFEKEQVKGVFTELAQRFPVSNILFDVTSSWMCKNSHRHDTIKLTNTTFKLALDDDKEIEKWADNLMLYSVRHYGDFEEWRNAGFASYWAMRLLPPMKKASRILHYKIR